MTAGIKYGGPRIPNSRRIPVITATHDHKMLDDSDRILWIKDGAIDKLQRRDEVDIRVGTVR